MPPLCGSPSETWDFSSAPNSEALQIPQGSPFPCRKVPELSASCFEQRVASGPGWLARRGCVCVSVGWGGGGSGQHGWRPALSQKGRGRPHLSHGAEVSHSPLRRRPFRTHTPVLGWLQLGVLPWAGLLLGLLLLEGLPFLHVLPFLSRCSPQKSR